MSIFEDDGFVIVEKDGIDADDFDYDDDVVSVSSSKSSLCLVEDPSKDDKVLSQDRKAKEETGNVQSEDQTAPHALPAEVTAPAPQPPVTLQYLQVSFAVFAAC